MAVFQRLSKAGPRADRAKGNPVVKDGAEAPRAANAPRAQSALRPHRFSDLLPVSEHRAEPVIQRVRIGKEALSDSPIEGAPGGEPVTQLVKIPRSELEYGDWGRMLDIMHKHGVQGDPSPAIQTENFRNHPQLLKDWRDFLNQNYKYAHFVQALNKEITALDLASGKHVQFDDDEESFSNTLTAMQGAATGRQFASNMAAHAKTKGFAEKSSNILPSVQGHNFELAMASQTGATFGKSGDFEETSGSSQTSHQAKYVTSSSKKQVGAQSLEAAKQLTGLHGEKPQAGATRVIDQGINPTTNSFPFQSDSSQFSYQQFITKMTQWAQGRKASAYAGVDEIRVVFSPGGRALNDCIVYSVNVDTAGHVKNERVEAYKHNIDIDDDDDDDMF